MPSLSDIRFKTEYRSDQDRLIEDFYVPCLERSIRYDRAVGYFTSSSLASAATGIVSLFHNGGRMQLLTSPHFNEADIEAIQKGYRAKEDVCVQALQRELDLSPSLLVDDCLSSLAWMIYKGLLEIQIAIRVDEHGRVRPGMFHEKLGIFYDSKENFVVFTGSANETQYAFEENFEMVDVFTSWEHDRQRAR